MHEKYEWKMDGKKYIWKSSIWQILSGGYGVSFHNHVNLNISMRTFNSFTEDDLFACLFLSFLFICYMPEFGSKNKWKLRKSYIKI